MLRYGCSVAMSLCSVSGVWPTLAVNAVGSFLIGLLSGIGLTQEWSLLLTVGLCGGFTTYSTFSLQTLNLFREGQPLPALFYATATFVVCLAAAWLGMKMGR